MSPLGLLGIPGVLGVVVGVPLGALIVLAWRRRPAANRGSPRILLALPGGLLATDAVDAAGRLARAEHATVVPTVVVATPYRFALDAPRPDAASDALDLLEAVDRRLRRAHVPVDSRVVQGRTARHGLRRIASQIRYDRMVVPAGEDHGGFAADDIGWLLAHLPGEVLVLRPATHATGSRPRHDEEHGGEAGNL
ncbi:MAG: universal stress protein [Solirubrobacteraceae bacterium]